MIAYFDASCLVALILNDETRDALVEWIDRTPATLTYSDFGWGGLVSAIGIRVRSGLLQEVLERELVGDAREILTPWDRLLCTPDDLAAAAVLVSDFSLKLRFPDAIHVAIARRIGGTFVSADTRQASAALAIGLSVFNPLGELS